MSPTAVTGQNLHRGPVTRTLFVNSGTRETQRLYEKGHKEPRGLVTTTRERQVVNGQPVNVRQTTVTDGKKSFQVTATHNLATGTRTVTDGTRVRARAGAKPTKTQPPAPVKSP